MGKKIILDPITRIEGHLRIDTSVDNGEVVEAWSKGEMFRGFEAMLVGRDPLDAPVITQRICGVCPVSHAVASVKNIESAIGLVPAANGVLLRNLILGANYLQSHILHFYHLAALDFVNVEDILAYDGNDPILLELKSWVGQEVRSNKILPAAPFLPKLDGPYPTGNPWNLSALSHYLEALHIRKEAHKMAALFGGKIPHVMTIVPGGVTCGVDPETVEDFRMRLVTVRRFIDEVYLKDVLAAAALFPEYAAIGRGVGNYLSYGVFDEGNATWLGAGTVISGRYEPLDAGRITEAVAASHYADRSPLHPSQGEIKPQTGKADAYSWLKAPRYGGQAMEVGPLARMIVSYHAGNPEVQKGVNSLLSLSGLTMENLPSVLGRHAARVLEASLLAGRMEKWLNALEPGRPSVAPYVARASGSGQGLMEAPRGALGHWVTIENNKIARYQCVVPSTWNFSPRDDAGIPGPVEQALIGTRLPEDSKGLEVARIVRSFDPCIACAVH